MSHQGDTFLMLTVDLQVFGYIIENIHSYIIDIDHSTQKKQEVHDTETGESEGQFRKFITQKQRNQKDNLLVNTLRKHSSDVL